MGYISSTSVTRRFIHGALAAIGALCFCACAHSPESATLRIDGSALESFNASWDRLYHSLSPEQQSQLSASIFPIALRNEKSSLDISPEQLKAIRPQDIRTQIDGMDYEEIIALAQAQSVKVKITHGTQYDGPRLPTITISFYIIGETDSDLLGAIDSTLFTLGFVEILPRTSSREHFPVAIFPGSDYELDVVIGRGCVWLVSKGPKIVPGTDANAFRARFKRLHATIEDYLSGLPSPHPRAYHGGPLPDGCPTVL